MILIRWQCGRISDQSGILDPLRFGQFPPGSSLMSNKNALSKFSGASVDSEQPEQVEPVKQRLVSLDAYRGFIMIMLAANGFGIAGFARLDATNPIWESWDHDWWQSLAFHFNHPAWESITGWVGVSFWDLIQPSFMFMVGVAMPYSYARREQQGSSTVKRHLHAATRAIVLVLIGVFLYSLKADQTKWIFTNVLAQIGLGYYFAYLLLGRSRQVQLIALIAILVGYWAFFKLQPPPDNYDFSAVNAVADDGDVFMAPYEAWSKNGNAAHFFDVWFLNTLRSPDVVQDAEEVAGDGSDVGGEIAVDEPKPQASLIRRWWFSISEPHTFNSGGYVTLNFIPSIATTLLGIFCGQLLMVPVSHRDKLLSLLLAAGTCLALGILAHHTVCPIVKRIWTPSWVLFSGGYTIAMLAAFYFVFDVLPFRKLAFPLVVIGINSIAVYLMSQLLRDWVSEKVVQIHFGGVLKSLFGNGAVSADAVGALVLPTATFVVFWLTSFWMYRNRYLLKV